ncbi:MAG TPA: hypothetical protein PK597_02835, partial [Oscillospiraceae bacterium]|nr:hypothetical protein [Oscillospiraceae bacterium]
MSDRFSFVSADKLIALLTSSHKALSSYTEQLTSIFTELGGAFRDSDYEELLALSRQTRASFAEVSQSFARTTEQLARYRDALYHLYAEDLAETAVCPRLPPRPQPPPGEPEDDGGDDAARQARFNVAIRQKLKDPHLSKNAKQAYRSKGSKCPVASDSYLGTAYYSPSGGFLKFNLDADLHGPCGTLATYFHEVGHSIDHSPGGKRCLSDDGLFTALLRKDCEDRIAEAQSRLDCPRENACREIRRALMADNDLYADASDILGAL